jgi:hypothetical protein
MGITGTRSVPLTAAPRSAACHGERPSSEPAAVRSARRRRTSSTLLSQARLNSSGAFGRASSSPAIASGGDTSPLAAGNGSAFCACRTRDKGPRAARLNSADAQIQRPALNSSRRMARSFAAPCWLLEVYGKAAREIVANQLFTLMTPLSRVTFSVRRWWDIGV